MLDLQLPVERVECAGLRIRRRDETDVAGPTLGDGEMEMARETMQPERIGAPFDRDLRAASPTDDREQDRRRVGPSGGVGLPDQRHWTGLPGAQLGAATGDRRAGFAGGQGDVSIHRLGTAAHVPAKTR